MKKFSIIGIIIALVLSMSMAVLATEEVLDSVGRSDSLKVSAEIKQKLGIEVSENVVKIYNISIHTAFASVQSIDELLEKEGLVLSEYYAIKSIDGMLKYRSIVENNPVDLSDVQTNQKAMKAFQDNTVISKISSDIKVYEIYYLSGETSYSGTAIYYKTNKGDFVYYIHYAIGGSEYLFPITDFCEYQKTIYNERAKYADLDGGVDISQLWDLSKYDIHSTNFDIKTNIQQQIGSENKQQINNFEDASSANSDHHQNILKWEAILIGTILLLGLSLLIGLRAKKLKSR